MDVEGAELDALAGGESWLQRTHPMIAIATYHRQDHLWKVPLAVNRISGVNTGSTSDLTTRRVGI